MEKDFKSIDLVVTGLEILDKAIKNREDQTKAFDDAVPRLKRKDTFQGILRIIGFCVLYIVLTTLCIMYDLEDGIILFTFVGGIALIVFIVIKINSPNKKLNAQIEENNRIKQMIEYMKANQKDLDLLIATKDKLFDFYIKNIKEGYELCFFAPVEKAGEEIGEYHEIFIDEFKLIKKTKYTTLEIEEKPEWNRQYKITLTIPYALYKQIKTWQ